MVEDLVYKRAVKWFARYYPSVDRVVTVPNPSPNDMRCQYNGYCGEDLVRFVTVEQLIEWEDWLEDNEERAHNNLMQQGWSTRFGSESTNQEAMQSTNELDTEKAIAFFKSRGYSDVHSVKRLIGYVMGRAGSDWVVGLNQQGYTIEAFPFDDVQKRLACAVAKPLLVVSFKHALTKEQVEKANNILSGRMGNSGWFTLVVDGMDESKVQVFGIDTPHINSMSLDEIEALLDGVRRAREASDPDRGLNS